VAGQADFQFVGSGAEAYDRFLVTPLFEPMAEVLLDAIALAPGEAFLDVACGPGVVARLGARRVGAAGSVTACDVSSEMIAVARAKPNEAGFPAIAYAQAAAAAMPFPAASFDAVACQQGLQFFPNQVAALTEMRRVVKVGGRLGVAVFRPSDGARLFTTLRDAGKRAGIVDADVFSRAVFAYGSFDDLQRDLEAADFRDVTVFERTVPVVFDSIDLALMAIRGTPFWPVIALQGPDAIVAFEREARRALEHFATDGPVRVDQHSNIAIAKPK
jgi:ubiquinone/menaquinone biosynthesis C-methylase UbiE